MTADLYLEFVIVCRCGFIVRALPSQWRAGAFHAYAELTSWPPEVSVGGP
ncbi:MAG: hypothetical protein ACREC5_02815 [Thermoplasmata archaeon]